MFRLPVFAIAVMPHLTESESSGDESSVASTDDVEGDANGIGCANDTSYCDPYQRDQPL